MKLRWTIAGVTFAIAMVMLFARLGHYALWDDESYTALAGIGVWHTGDTTAVIDHNIVAFRNGELLKNLKDRFNPPLPAYFVAPFVGIGGRSALAARLPFAICGAALVAFALFQLARKTEGAIPIALASLTLLSGVAMFLYFRQCRYYGLTMFAFSMLVDFYARRNTFAIMFCAIILLASNYISFAGAVACLGIDYLFFGRRVRRLSIRQIATITIPIALIGVAIVAIWNPLGADPHHFQSEHPFRDRLTILWWFFRDFASGEFAATAILLAGIVVCFWKRDQLLMRGLIAIAVFIATCAMLSPQSVQHTFFADVRYIAAIIPLALATQWRVLMNLNRYFALVLATLVLFTNALTLSPLIGAPLRSTPLAFVRELVHPLPEPYTPTITWISKYVRPGQSVWVLPEEMAYPLMFHAPQVQYAWQLPSSARSQSQFANLPAIHFLFEFPPDFVIAFGLARDRFQSLAPPPGIRFQLVDEMQIFWHDLYRPELFGRSFEPVRPDPKQHEGIYFFELRRG